MIARIIDWCAANRFLVFTGTLVLTLWGMWAMTATALDRAIRNLAAVTSDLFNQAQSKPKPSAAAA